MRRLAIALLALTVAHANAALVISDVDDTIKITNSGSIIDATWSGIFKDDVFPGMPELYRAWGEKNEIHFVTGSPSLVKGKIRELLKHQDIKYASLVTRGNMLEGTHKYKMREISRIMDSKPEEQVILLGDDVSHDHSVFQELTEKYPGRVLASYIRPVKNRPALEGQVPYVTAYDILVTEFAEQRMNLMDYTVVTAAVMGGNAAKLFPSFAWCPTELDGTAIPTENSTYLGAQQVEDRIESICRGRRSGSENLH